MYNTELAVFMLCYITYLEIATQADIKTSTCYPKIYTLSYVVEGTSRRLMRHIGSTKDHRNLKGS